LSPATSFPPFALGLASTHLGWGTRRHFTRRPRDPPGLETPTIIIYHLFFQFVIHLSGGRKVVQTFMCVLVGTLNQGYPLLRYKDAVHVRRLWAARRMAPDPTAWVGLGAPRGKKKMMHPRVHHWFRTSTDEYRTPVRTTRTHYYDQGLPRGHVGSLR
jgi:hypothetical protein